MTSWRWQVVWVILAPALSSCGGDENPEEILYPLPIILDPATSPEILLENLSFSLNERQRDFFDDLLSQDFIYRDDTTQPTSEWSRERELALLLHTVNEFKAIEFSLEIASSDDAADGCQLIVGVVDMVLSPSRRNVRRVRDHTQLTVCRGVGDELWRIAAWRTTGKVQQSDSDRTQMSWGEAKLFAEQLSSE